jgi:hypothetical protein
LFPDTPGRDSSVTVRFRGVEQSASAVAQFAPGFEAQPATPGTPDSDWRWGLVAVRRDGTVRYSSLQRGARAELTVAVEADDDQLWLVVTATPSNIQKIFWDQIYYSIYRYPWMVEVHGASPEGFQPGAWAAPANVTGAPHVNGGGFVASTAQVAASAYVGPNARVLGTARVSGSARIEDWALVDGNARVSDNAIIRDHGWVRHEGQVYGAAVVEDFAAVYAGQVYESASLLALTVVDHASARVRGSARVAAVMNQVGAHTLSGTAQVLGDLELHTSLSAGVFYGFITAEMASAPQWGATRVEPAGEVTLAGPLTWIE